MSCRTDAPGETRTGGQILVECLHAHHPSLWTCVPGESFLPILDALYELGRASELVTARHEAGAANMAEAAGKLTGRAAVCLVTRGPGATQASVAVHTAYQDGTPLVLVVGQVGRALRGREAFQEMDFDRVFGSSAKSVVELDDADRIPEHVARAMHVAHGDRPGPVILVAPEDVLADRTSAPVLSAPTEMSPSIADNGAKQLKHELRSARRPILIAGGPGWTAEVAQAVARFAERNTVPVAAGFRWQDAIDNRCQSYVGYLGLGSDPALRSAVATADLVVGLGPRLDDPTTAGYELTDNTSRLMLVSQSAAELTASSIPHVGLHGSLASVADALDSIDLEASQDRRSWTRGMREAYEVFRTPPERDSRLDLAAIVRHVRDHAPDDAIVTNGAGNYTVWVQRFFEYRQPRTQLAPRSGAMGYGLPAGLAAAAVHPGRQVITFAGDGCFLMSGNELATAVQHRLNLVVIVVNNSMFGTIRMHQERAYPGRVIATDLRNPDFAAYAASFGVLGLRVIRTADFPTAFAAASRHAGPALIEVRTDPDQITPDRTIEELRTV